MLSYNTLFHVGLERLFHAPSENHFYLCMIHQYALVYILIVDDWQEVRH